MKKAICVKQGDWRFLIKGTIENSNSPTYGETVTVSQCPVFKDAYDLAEYPLDSDGNRQSFAKKWFIPTSEIDETELAKQREELQTA